MPYIGAKQLKASDLKRFSVTGSTSATHALSWTAPNEQSLIITINGVKQHDSAYTISGSPTTITLSSALVSSDEMEVIGINDIGTTITPAQNSVDTDKIADNAVTTAKIADDQITTAKIADDQITSAKLANAINITSGNSLTIDSGATITNNGTANGFSGDVYFYGELAASQTTTRAVWTKLTGLTNNELDSDSAFDGTTFTVPSGKGGKYFLIAQGRASYDDVGNDGEQTMISIYVNSSPVNTHVLLGYSSTGLHRRVTQTVTTIINLSVGDTVEMYGYTQDLNATAAAKFTATDTHLSGWRISQ
jgi:hypothetical protein